MWGPDFSEEREIIKNMFFESSEEVSCAVIRGKSFPDRGSEADACWLLCFVIFVFLKNNEQICVAGIL